MNYYDIGDLVRLSATFTDLAGAPVSPSAVVLRVKAPDGTVSTPTPTNDGIGVYRHDLAVTQAGLWCYRWEGTGAVTAAGERTFMVRASSFV